MSQGVMRWTAAVVVSYLISAQVVMAQESARTLPTLLIKGEVVSVDSNDPAASLLKVKDRYGFETPIYLTPETKIAQGDQMLTVSSLTPGAAVEVEYNFDINTAKRHGVKVMVSGPATTEAAVSSAVPAMAPVAGSAVAPEAAPAEPASPVVDQESSETPTQ